MELKLPDKDLVMNMSNSNSRTTTCFRISQLDIHVSHLSPPFTMCTLSFTVLVPHRSLILKLSIFPSPPLPKTQKTLFIPNFLFSQIRPKNITKQKWKLAQVVGIIINHNQNPVYSHSSKLNALVLVLVLSSSGMVAIEDFAFVILSFFYMYFMSKYAFPTLSPSDNHPVFDHNRLLNIYCFVGAVVGVFLPVGYIFEGILEGDKEGIKAVTPHVFLLASQLFLEGVAFSDRFSLPMRVLVPVVYNATRMFSLMEWVRSEVWKAESEFHGSYRRWFMGRVLAVVNLVYWGFNLFGFLIPFYLPRAFKRYYSDEKNAKQN